MNNKLLPIIGISFILIFILKFIFVFLEIPVYKYGIYLYWVIALSILALILPKKTGKMFK